MRTAELLIRGAHLQSGQRTDLLIRNDRIIDSSLELRVGADIECIDATGCLVMPGLVDAHAHIDKTLWGLPWYPHEAGPTLINRIENERRVMGVLQLSPEKQSARLLRHMVARGTTHVRTHIDVGPDIKLSCLHEVQAMYEAHRDYIDLQIVAFPQTGVMIQSGMLNLLDQAVLDGAQVIGGLDPIGVDNDPEGQLNAIFAIAGRRGCGIDIHLHDRGETGAMTIEMIAERTKALGLAGRVAISHAFCLGMLKPKRLDKMISLLLDNDIAIMTHAPAGGMPFPPVRLLAERGVHLFTGSDGVRDSWSPLNTGDMLERAYLIAYINGFLDDSGLEIALNMATYGGARLMGAKDYGLNVGSVADLVIVQAETAAEAVAKHPIPCYVFKRGRLVARNGHSLLPLID